MMITNGKQQNDMNVAGEQHDAVTNENGEKGGFECNTCSLHGSKNNETHYECNTFLSHKERLIKEN